MSALCSVRCLSNGDLTEKKPLNERKNKQTDNASFKSMQRRKTSYEPQVRPFLNQLFIWIGLDGLCDFPFSFSSHQCPSACLWMVSVSAWYVSHFLIVDIALHWPRSILWHKFFLVLWEGTDQSWMVTCGVVYDSRGLCFSKGLINFKL